MKNIILGCGEVGSSLHEVLKDFHETHVRDVEPGEDDPEKVEVLNVCIPYGEGFTEAVKGYQERYRPELTIIHSTVKPGTSRELGAVHSPIHGLHPNLASGIKTFVKYVGGELADDVLKAKEFLMKAGIKVQEVSSPEASEWSKVLCTTRYGWEITFAKEVAAICEREGLSYGEVYGWAKHYNDGYTELGKPEYHRSLLKNVPGPIGGHCVVPNARIIGDEWVASVLLERDSTR